MKHFFAVLLSLCLITPLSARELRIAIEGAYPPFSAVNERGELFGFDVDIARALCEEMQRQCTLMQQDWDGLIPALLARRFDAIIASMTITDERKQAVSFTNKYYQTPARYLRRKESGIEATLEGLRGKNIGVQRATIFEHYIKENYGDSVNIRLYGNFDEMYLDLQNGRLEVAFVDGLSTISAFLETPAGQEFEFFGPIISDEQWIGEGIGIAVRKDDDALREQFNAAIQTVRADGRYDAIRSKYFDFDIYGD